ncbi:4-alpha-glucanotransferase [Cryobacterium sp. PH31-AA6]|uniref:4-alpha-glucanotransferase n=1 Tax=Cryobacterium sp. PH31-AA6 TaxID=3046205 RepID=UPI0024B899AF|nr:4-alpha-glucanotransferase [Cryobacterium sp. PH31-AA6]MDJ0324826.1 4-alpha-glucanotransferase [Cryobacterium sp. PH31-AA6]
MKRAQTDGQTSALLELAQAHGVDTSFRGWDGVERTVAEQTLLGVLTALGVPVGTPKEIESSLAEQRSAPWRRLLPPTLVAREGSELEVPVHAGAGTAVTVTVLAEDGSRHPVAQRGGWSAARDVDGRQISRSTFVVPDTLPLGWHTLVAEHDAETARSTLVVTPERLQTTQALAGQQDWGLMAQLYSVRSTRSWGIGDFADLADLAAISGAQYGADFVLVNPLHASEPAPPVEPSPYLPSTRRFFHPLYIRVEDVPEYAYLPADSRTVVEDLAALLQPANLATDRLDRDSSYEAKLIALELIHLVRRSPAREEQFALYRRDQGQGLEDFALWCALTERFPADSAEWLTEPTGPRGSFAGKHREELADRVTFHCWLQWVCDHQLETAQRAATDAGMGIGIVHDLAVGVQRHGSDAWTLRDVLAQGMTVGAPPDMFNQIGQNWSQPPWHPGRLAESGYAAYRDMLRSVLRHAGGVRVDHILGLFRLWWIPEGAGPGDGTYVHYDHEALIGILALEAQRAGAIVIGEDLGVFEGWVREYLAERCIFGTSILWFERHDGVPFAPESYRQQCLTSVNTHDLPPTAGYLAGDHVALRESLGLLGRPVEEERAADAEEKEAVLALVRERGLLPAAGTDAGIQETVEALYAFTALTPSSLLGVALVDAVGERRTQNQPGTMNEYPNWRIPLAGPDGESVLIDDLPGNTRFASLITAMTHAQDEKTPGR